MNSTASKVLVFAIGAAIGSVTTWKLIERKYHRIAEDEISEIRDLYKRKAKEDHEDYEQTTQNIVESAREFYKAKSDIKEYSKILGHETYTDYASSISENEKKENENKVTNNGPYIITPDEFGEMDGYATISLTCYADGVIEDEWGEIMEDSDFEELVGGAGALDHFGEYEEDSVFVRNDEHRTDYEILRDNKDYISTEDS